MTPKAKHKSKFNCTLKELDQELRELFVLDHIPMGWGQIENDAIEPAKTRVTIRLDTDMVKWFRKLGPSYQTRINKILRLYFHGIVGGEIPLVARVEEDAREREIYREEVRARLDKMG